MEPHEPHDESQPHDEFQHVNTARGRVFLWGGLAAGVLLVVLLLTHGFGLFTKAPAAEAPPALVRKGDQIFVPETSPLRERLRVMPAATEATNGRITAPGFVESDPVRTVTVLPPGGGRVCDVKVALGDRV